MMEHLKRLIWTNDPYRLPADSSTAEEGEELDLEDWLQDERLNLSIQLDNEIVVIGSLGLWDGRRMGYKIIPSGNIRDCLVPGRDDYSSTWYVDESGDLMGEGCHHDGTNIYRYRTWRKGVSEGRKEALLNKLYRGTATEQDIEKVTKRLGPYVCKVYGWKVPRKQAKKKEE